VIFRMKLLQSVILAITITSSNGMPIAMSQDDDGAFVLQMPNQHAISLADSVALEQFLLSSNAELVDDQILNEFIADGNIAAETVQAIIDDEFEHQHKHEHEDKERHVGDTNHGHKHLHNENVFAAGTDLSRNDIFTHESHDEDHHQYEPSRVPGGVAVEAPIYKVFPDNSMPKELITKFISEGLIAPETLSLIIDDEVKFFHGHEHQHQDKEKHVAEEVHKHEHEHSNKVFTHDDHDDDHHDDDQLLNEFIAEGRVAPETVISIINQENSLSRTPSRTIPESYYRDSRPTNPDNVFVPHELLLAERSHWNHNDHLDHGKNDWYEHGTNDIATAPASGQ